MVPLVHVLRVVGQAAVHGAVVAAAVLVKVGVAAADGKKCIGQRN